MPTTTTTDEATSLTDQDRNKSSSGSRYELWYKGEGEPTAMLRRGAPTHLVIHALELLAPMVEAQASDPFWAAPEYLKEIMSQPCWEVISQWVTKIEDDIYSAERDGLI